MARYKPYNYGQRVMIPVSLEEQILPGTLEHAIHEVVENRLDLSPFGSRYRNDETGRPAINPKILLKVVLLAYSRGIVGSRRIESLCRENIIFMALTCDYCPDHATIADFVSGMNGQIHQLFTQVLLICQETGLLGGTYFAIDGCKIPGNASKKWSGTFDELRDRKAAIEKRLTRLIEEHQAEDRKSTSPDDDDSPGTFQKRQSERLSKQADRIEEFLKTHEPRIGKQGTELKSNVIDPDSAKMSTSHGMIQGYNLQAVVDDKHQVIVAGLASGDGNDTTQAAVMLPIMRRNLKAIGFPEAAFKKMTFVGDCGYFSVENLRACETAGVNAIIPDNQFRQRDPRLAGQKKYQPKGHGKFPLSAFSYDSCRDVYRCPAGHPLASYARQTTFHGRKCRMFVGKAEVCQACTLMSQCLTKSGKRRTLVIPLADQKPTITDVMKVKVDSEEGRKLYGGRMKTVEPVFANLRENKKLQRLTLRGRIKATIQWLLWGMVQNIEKIANYGLAR